MHLVGAVMTFGVGALYILVQTLLSFFMQPHVHSKTTFLVRVGIGVWTLCSIISSILDRRSAHVILFVAHNQHHLPQIVPCSNPV